MLLILIGYETLFHLQTFKRCDMTPKDKAIELFNKYEKETRIFKINGFEYDKNKSKNCALIAVDEVLEYQIYLDDNYWFEVKQEIQKL
jgi:hypothetical protein